MKGFFGISSSAAALLGLSLLGVVLIFHAVGRALPMFLAVALCGVSSFLCLLGLRSAHWRFKGYALFALLTWWCVLFPLSVGRILPHGVRRIPVPSSVTVQGFSRSEAEQLYADSQDMSRGFYWSQFRHQIAMGRLKQAWLQLSGGPEIITNLSRGEDNSVVVTSVRGTNLHVTRVFGWLPASAAGTNVIH